MSKMNIKDLPLSYDREYTMTIDTIYNSNMTVYINNRRFYISIPKNISWMNIRIYEGMICIVKKERYGKMHQYSQLTLIDILEEEQEEENTYQYKNNESYKKQVIEQYYEILQCDKYASYEVIKKNYRTLIRQYHYDTLLSKDLPKDILDFAQERAKMINEAYEQLSKAKSA